MKIFSFLWKHRLAVGTVLVLVIMHISFFPSINAFVIKHWLLRGPLHLIAWTFFFAGVIKIDPDKKREDLIVSLVFMVGLFLWAWRL